MKGSDGNNLAPTWSGDTYTFADLEQYDEEGYAYTYRVEETQVTGYEAPSYSGEGNFDITNTIADSEDKEVSGTKTWVDGGLLHNNAEEVELTLYRKIASESDWTKVSSDEYSFSWGTGDDADTYTYSGLEVYDANGYAYEYKVEEAELQRRRKL